MTIAGVATGIPETVGMDADAMQRMYRLLALAKHDERYVSR